MHTEIRVHDWASTPLGPIDAWPQSLKTAIEIMLGAGVPTMLLWGKDLIQIYNDSFRHSVATLLPLGRPHHESRPEVREFDVPIFERVWLGETVVLDNARLAKQFTGRSRDMWFTASYSPFRDEFGRATGIWISLIETTERVLVEATLRENEARLKEILEHVPVGVGVFDSAGKVLKVNPEMLRLFGVPDALAIGDFPWPIFDRNGRRLAPGDLPASRALRGEVVLPEVELAIDIPEGKRWLKVGAVPCFRDGTISGVIATAHDVTEAKESAGRLKVLIAELQHRTRNLIAMVRVLADKTIERSASLDDFRSKYRTRLVALARVQVLLSRLSEGAGLTFDALLRAELAAHAGLDGETRVTLDGPAGVRLRSSILQTLALALHELATNASKYGAFSQKAGRLAVRWRVEDDPERSERKLHVEWRESGVAMPEPDATAPGGGYGRELIERVLPYQLRAETSFKLGADGVCCTIALHIGGEAAH